MSCNNNIGLKEGQHLPETHNILFTQDRWDPNKKIDWLVIKSIWNKYWDRSKDILLEKVRQIFVEQKILMKHLIIVNTYA